MQAYRQVREMFLGHQGLHKRKFQSVQYVGYNRLRCKVFELDVLFVCIE